MNDYQHYETKHSYQDDINDDPNATDPLMEEREENPLRATGLPPEDYRSELDDVDLDEDLVHVVEEEGFDAERPKASY